MADPVNALRAWMQDRTPSEYTAETAPSALAPLYNALAPAPNTEYGNILPFARDTNTGATRWAMPNALRETAGGVLDLMSGVDTGRVTPRAAETLMSGGVGASARSIPQNSLGALGGSGMKQPAGVTVYRGGKSQERSVMAPDGVYVTFHKPSAEQWGDVQEHQMRTMPFVLDLGNYDSRAREFVARELGMKPSRLSKEEFEEAAAEIFIQNSGVERLRQWGFPGYQLGHDMFLLGDLSDYKGTIR